MNVLTPLSALILVGLSYGSAVAETLTAPKGEVLLSISGAITQDNGNGVVSLDLDQLQAMETMEFTTSTIWMEDEVTFTGVSLSALLDLAGAEGTAINAIALNDYKVEIPVDEITEEAPIVAYLMNGEEMSPRGKGPLWVVYPYDADPAYRSEVVFSRSIWQLDRIEVTD
ncbi:molybdopterin-dependent oxidoreductase [uncultured Sulfitobacter sp.]|uniref:molybdopterin-dependent oxidoreductase n=1 Tax=uncultured Sulfitobacter sp. TaxID=191468 RepID=UPI00262E147E|nr:molybdopterin-dependent oxidoreductase [uncultured Sulfitobacter sp.]